MFCFFLLLFQFRSIPNEEFYLISNLSRLVLYKGKLLWLHHVITDYDAHVLYFFAQQNVKVISENNATIENPNTQIFNLSRYISSIG